MESVDFRGLTRYDLRFILTILKDRKFQLKYAKGVSASKNVVYQYLDELIDKVQKEINELSK